MAVKIRMSRLGRRHRPFFRINAVDSRTPRDGRILEKLGHYDPVEKDKEKQVVLNMERIKHWLDLGAVPSDTVSDILKKHGLVTKQYTEKLNRREKAKAIAKTKGTPFNEAARVAVKKAAEVAAAAAKAAEEEAAAKVKAAEEAAAAKAKAAEEAAAAKAKAAEEASEG
jgi:small subunit ribosomal protein S16